MALFIIGRTYLNFLSRRTLLTSVARFLPLVQFKLSDIGEGIAEVQVKEWHVNEGDHVTQFDKICEVQSDKASVTITSRYDGTIKKLYYGVDDVAKVGTTLVDIEVEEKFEDNDSEEAREETTETGIISDRKVLATPSVRRLANEHGVNLREINGTGSSGRVMKDDVIKSIQQKAGSAVPVDAEIPVATPLFHASQSVISSPTSKLRKFESLRTDKVIPIRGYTRAMVKSMTEALKIPHFGFYDEFNVDRLVTLRGELKKSEARKGARMSYMPIIIKAVSLALTKVPILNAIIDEKLENIICKASHNISIAVDTPEGLVVPNIKHCEQRTLWEIAVELNRLQEACNRMQISAEDLKDGTFTLSNIGMIGGTYLAPIIMPPQLAIGAIGQISNLPRCDKQGNILTASVMKISWAADHRVIDGATLARFSNLVKEYLENPFSMIADLR